MGVALSSCTVPAAGRPTFEIGEGEMEFGVGIHGEPGRRPGLLSSLALGNVEPQPPPTWEDQAFRQLCASRGRRPVPSSILLM